MLNGANPFDTAHEAQMAQIKISGKLATLLHILVLQKLLGFKQEKHILAVSIFSQRSRGLRLKNSAQVLTSCLWLVNEQGNFNPGVGFQGFGIGPDFAWTVASFSLPEHSSSCCNTLWIDLIIFFTPIFYTSFGVGSDLELSFVFLSIKHTLLKSKPAIVISRTQRLYYDMGSNLTRLLSILQDSKQASNSALSI